VSYDLHSGLSFQNDVIIIDGMWGSGKSLLSSIVGSLDRVEKKRIDHVFEYVSIGEALGHTSPEFSRLMVKIYADLDQYNNLIGREVNLRVNDDSGYRNTPRSSRYLFRLFGGEGDNVVEKINSKNIALLLLTHHLSGNSEPVFDALRSRLYFIEVIRHPLQLVNYWTTYFTNFERSREFTLCIDFEGFRVPWFAADWREEYIYMTPIDKAVRCIYELQELSFLNPTDSLNRQFHSAQNRHLVVAFEHVLANTEQVVQQISTFLHRDRTRATSRSLKKQDVPRELSGRGKAVNPMNWLPNPKLTYQDQLSEIKMQLRNNASIRSVVLMEKSTTQYEIRLEKILNALPEKTS
jgi:hypothetical protein